MWRLSAFLARNPDISRDAFLNRLVDQWAPSAASFGQQRGALKQVVVSLPQDLSGTGLESLFPPVFDALVELWFDSSEDALSTLSQFAGAEDALRLDDAIDPSTSVCFLGEVKPKKPDHDGKSGVRMTVAGHVREGWNIDDAHRYWSEVHPVVAQKVPETWERLSLYQQIHNKNIIGDELVSWLCPYQYYPMSADMGAPTIQQLLAAYDNEQYMAIIRPDEQKFSRPEDMLTFVSDRRLTFN